MSTTISEKHRNLDAWMDKVDRHVEAIAGLSVWDLDDCPFSDWHDEGYSPREAAQAALQEMGWTTLSHVGGYKSEGFKVVI